ncbi:MAG: hypothetical protein ACM3JJ_08425 [Hyphomicrobiales bacterium]
MSKPLVRVSMGAIAVVVLGWGATFGVPSASAQIAAPIHLAWTAPGDDGNTGRASFYDIRYSTSPVAGTDTLTWWTNASQLTGEPAPGIAGATDSMLVYNLAIGTTYYFIMKAGDEVPNWSGYSNMASATVAACNVPTNAPSNVAAVEDTAAVDVIVSWSGAPSPADPSVVVNVYRAVGTGSMTLRTTLAGSATNYRDTSVNQGGTYRYQIAWGIACGEGPRSATVSITTAPATSGGPGPGAASGGSFHAYPNPSSGPINLVVTVNGSTAAHARVRLYTPTGQWVADLVDDTFDPGQHTVSWSRLSRSGQPVSPGYYEAIGTIGGTKVRERLVLLP